MNLASPAFEHNGPIPARYTCDGENIHPPLEVSYRPENVKSYCLIMDDLDAMDSGRYWLHWTVWNIHPDIAMLEEGGVPEGAIEGKTSARTHHYFGPCPPSGVHRYRFSLFALNAELNVDVDAGSEELKSAMGGACARDC